ncbi:MAG: cytochrome c biogenesis protein CcsA [Candidatus Thalassarchaeaceae archaeon]|nr:cytochrome c biogenesis protein CcsA [Candidatus Thalassarchaeaceae archaeon]
MDTAGPSTTVGEILLSQIGWLLLVIGIAFSVLQAISTGKHSSPISRDLAVISQVSPFLLLVFCFVTDVRSLELVFRFGGEDLPLFYRISAVWSSRSGPLLLWAALMGIVTRVMSIKMQRNSLETSIMHSWVAFILLLSFFLGPFDSTTSVSSSGLNPLLQTDLMVIHPPVVFAFYSLCIATSSVVMAGIIRKDSSLAIHNSQLYWARAGFVVGTVGIGLGGLWAYTVLDWGGYWAWDPVETGSLLPWLCLLLVIHARSKPGGSAILASPAAGLLAGALAFHATLVTRANGVWASVHAFVADGEGALPQDPYLRVLDVVGFDAIGAELIGYLSAIILLCVFVVVHLSRVQKEELASRNANSLMEQNKFLALLLLLIFSIVSFWIGSVAVIVVGLSLMYLLVNGDNLDPPLQWVFSGIALMLFSSWTWNAEWYQSLVGMIPFLVPWLVSEKEDDWTFLTGIFTSTSIRLRTARSVPWYGGIGFLLLTWMILTVEIDGTSLQAHEFYGSPFIAILAIGLAAYSWGASVSPRKGAFLIVIAVVSSLSAAIMAGSIDLPGDPRLPISTSVSRGSLAAFMLVLLMFSLPFNIRNLLTTAKSHARKIYSGGFRGSNSSRTRILASHISHVGILLLLIGHVFTTTLVDRSDPSHLVTLEMNQPVEYGNYEYVLVDTIVLSEGDEGFDFNVGDGFLGVVVEMRKDGELVDTLTPGILRFGPTPRSEVDRHVGLFGDTIMIMDGFQVQDLMPALFFNQTDDLDRIRVTIHELQGSHLVWTGWVLTILGGILAFSSSEKPFYEEEE